MNQIKTQNKNIKKKHLKYFFLLKCGATESFWHQKKFQSSLVDALFLIIEEFHLTCFCAIPIGLI